MSDNLTLLAYASHPKWGQGDTRNDMSRLCWRTCRLPYKFRCWARIHWCLRSPFHPPSRNPLSTRRRNGHRSRRGCPRLLRLSSNTPSAESALAGCSHSGRLSSWSSRNPFDCLEPNNQNSVYIYIHFIYSEILFTLSHCHLKLFIPMQIWPVLSRMYPGEHSHS